MRLIDADALKDYIDSCECCDHCKKIGVTCHENCEFPDYLTEGWERVIDEQPAVDALPVEWIENYLRNYPYMIPIEKTFVREMIKTWEERKEE